MRGNRAVGAVVAQATGEPRGKPSLNVLSATLSLTSSYFMVRLFCRLLFTHLDVIDPFGDQLLTHFGSTVCVHVVINQFQVIELE